MSDARELVGELRKWAQSYHGDRAGGAMSRAADLIESQSAALDAMREALESINRITSAGNRTLDEMIRDMGYANDRARAALSSPGGQS